MGKKILGVVVGYIAMALFVFILFTVLYLILGTENSFQPGTFQVSTVWIICSIILSFIAAMLGGYICTWIAKDRKTALILAALVFALGIIFSLPKLTSPVENKARSSELSNLEAMQQAEQPSSILILNPIIGALGIFFGAKLKKDKMPA